ncbi:uncharacterized protein [Phyllobates terribilis]|uniref:uncharacterized protein n=1 Tax=Phyllobates terribilis TaxID=111132 RepID=UPI003CCA7A34
MDAGKRKRQEFKKKKESKKKGGFEVVRCENLFTGNVRDHFPTPMSGFDCCFASTRISCDINHTYPPGIMKEKNRVKIVPGMRLGKDVRALLSNGGKRDYLVRNNGVKVPLLDSISGKYLLICCFAIPIMTDLEDAELCRNMISVYSQLKAAANNLEMVVVARITRYTMVVNDDEESAFNRFFNAFPCLAVPFSDSESRDLICYSLGLGLGLGLSAQSSALLLDPDQLVLQTDAECFSRFGAAGFPFTPIHLDALERQDEDIRLRLDFIQREMKKREEAITTPWVPVSLVELVGSCHLLRRSGCIINNNKEEEEEVISVSELSKKKCVGLYLCYDGIFMRNLARIHNKCVALDLEFEVVLVYLPFDSDTTSFMNAVHDRLYKEKITSWWVMPLVDEVGRRLQRLTSSVLEDELVVLTDDGWGELIAKSVIEEKGYRGDYSYPFTRKSLLDKNLAYFRSLTIESLLSVGHLISHSGDYVPVSVLKDKNVLLCMDGAGGQICKAVCSRYDCIQEKYPGTQVVFVQYPATRTPEEWRHPPPWLLSLPSEAAHSVFVKIFVKAGIHDCPRSLIALGKDGVVLSIQAQYRVGKIKSLFDDTLRQEVERAKFKFAVCCNGHSGDAASSSSY